MMTSYKTVLLHAASEQRFPAQLSVAVDLATRFRAHLIALAIAPLPIEIPAGVPGVPETVKIDKYRKIFLQAAERMKEQFARATAGRRCTAEWMIKDAPLRGTAALLIAHAHAADLIVAGVAEPGAKGIKPLGITEHLILGSGRPVLLAPRAGGTHRPVGNNVLIAWNGSRESTRATYDAMPILKAARYVKVLSINTGRYTTTPAMDCPQALCATLARHGVRAECEAIALPGADVGAALLSATRAANADLLVMGCYSHSRLYEHAFGGASQHVLAESTVPVLMSH